MAKDYAKLHQILGSLVSNKGFIRKLESDIGREIVERLRKYISKQTETRTAFELDRGRLTDSQDSRIVDFVRDARQMGIDRLVRYAISNNIGNIDVDDIQLILDRL